MELALTRGDHPRPFRRPRKPGRTRSPPDLGRSFDHASYPLRRRPRAGRVCLRRLDDLVHRRHDLLDRRQRHQPRGVRRGRAGRRGGYDARERRGRVAHRAVELRHRRRPDRHRRRFPAGRRDLHLRPPGMQLHRVPRRPARRHRYHHSERPDALGPGPGPGCDADRLHVHVHQPRPDPHLLGRAERDPDAHGQRAGRVAQQSGHRGAEPAQPRGRDRRAQPAPELYTGPRPLARLRAAAGRTAASPEAAPSPGAGGSGAWRSR